MSKTQKQPLVVKPTVSESPKIVAETWKIVQDIATSEIQVNGRMLFYLETL